MASPCDRCPNRAGCDLLANWCLLEAHEVAIYRPDLLKGEGDVMRLRRQKREHNARARAKRRDEAAVLRLMFSRLLDEYGTFGRHSKLMRDVKAAANTQPTRRQSVMAAVKELRG